MWPRSAERDERDPIPGTHVRVEPQEGLVHEDTLDRIDWKAEPLGQLASREPGRGYIGLERMRSAEVDPLSAQDAEQPNRYSPLAGVHFAPYSVAEAGSSTGTGTGVGSRSGKTAGAAPCSSCPSPRSIDLMPKKSNVQGRSSLAAR